MTEILFQVENGIIRCIPRGLLSSDMQEVLRKYTRQGLVLDANFYPLLRALKARSLPFTFAQGFQEKLTEVNKKFGLVLDWNKELRFHLRMDSENIDPALRLVASRYVDPRGKIKKESRIGNLLKKLEEKGANVEFTAIAQSKILELKKKKTVYFVWRDGWVHVHYDVLLVKKLADLVKKYTENQRLSDPLTFFHLKQMLEEKEGWVVVEDAVNRFLRDYGKIHISLVISPKFYRQIEVLYHPSSLSQEYRKILNLYMDEWNLLKDYRELEMMSNQMRSAGCSVRIAPEVLDLIQENARIASGNLSVTLKQPLYRYQQVGALFLLERGKAILADDMGLGKTVQALAAIAQLIASGKASRALVFCPASLKYQWWRECEKFTSLSASLITGDRKQREKGYSTPAQVYIVNYELLLRDFPKIASLGGEIIVLDEAQRIKNYKTQTHQLMRNLGNARYIFALTGTPIENELMELYTIMRFVNSEALGTNVEKFMRRYVIKNFFGGVAGYRNVDEVRKRVSALILRRMKKEVLQELPEVVENTFWVEMHSEQEKLYRELRKDMQELLKDLKSKPHWRKEEIHRIYGQLTLLREVCDSSELLDEQKPFSAKVGELVQLMDELLRSEHKILIFSQWEKMTRIIQRELEKRKIPCVRFYGELSDTQRRKVLEHFTEDPDIPILISTDAGAYGVNLQVADVVVNFDLPYNPAKLEQRIARAHRFGQKKTVNVINLITPRSVESGILKLLYRKKKLFEDLIDKLDTMEVLESATEAAELLEQLLEG
ncbi:MAG: DEAD/DEAH box helicase [bacterium JZ-2024 1]